MRTLHFSVDQTAALGGVVDVRRNRSRLQLDFADDDGEYVTVTHDDGEGLVETRDLTPAQAFSALTSFLSDTLEGL